MALFQDYPGEPVPERKNTLDFTDARDSEWQWHKLDRMRVCTSLQTGNHASTPPLSLLQARCPFCHPTNSVKALKAAVYKDCCNYPQRFSFEELWKSTVKHKLSM